MGSRQTRGGFCESRPWNVLTEAFERSRFDCKHVEIVLKFNRPFTETSHAIPLLGRLARGQEISTGLLLNLGANGP
jgi:hypothetical protein